MALLVQHDITSLLLLSYAVNKTKYTSVLKNTDNTNNSTMTASVHNNIHLLDFITAQDISSGIMKFGIKL